MALGNDNLIVSVELLMELDFSHLRILHIVEDLLGV